MYPALVDRQPLHNLLDSLCQALDLRWSKIKREGGYTDHILFGEPQDIAYATRSLKNWGFLHIVADAGVAKSIIIKFIWTPGETV